MGWIYVSPQVALSVLAVVAAIVTGYMYNFRKKQPYTLVIYWKSTWGKALPPNAIVLPPLPKDVTDGTEEDSFTSDPFISGGDLLPERSFIDLSLVGKPDEQYLIRADYIRIYDAVKKAYDERKHHRKPPAVIVMGQPGIGKSVWIYYAIRRRLGLKLPTMLYQGGTFFQFTKSGVSQDVNPDFSNPKDPHWCFVDSAEAPGGIPLSMSSTGHPGVFPIYVTSPNESRWNHLQQSRFPEVLVMNPWTWEEMECASTLYPNVDAEKLKERFYGLGPTPRICLDYTDDQAAEFKRARQRGIDKMDPMTILSDATDAVDQHVDSTGHSHKICLIRRPDINKVSSRQVIYPMSASVVQQLLLNRERLKERGILEMWRKFSDFPDARGMTGAAFEAYVHDRFRQEIKITARRMLTFSSRCHMLSPSYDKNPRLKGTKVKFLQTTPHTTLEVKIDFKPHDSVVYEGTMRMMTKENVYYQPKSGQQVGIDAFFIHQGHLYLLLYTGGITHGANDKLVKFMERFDGLPTGDNWRFIFVIPDTLRKFSADPDPLIGALSLYTAGIPMQ